MFAGRRLFSHGVSGGWGPYAADAALAEVAGAVGVVGRRGFVCSQDGGCLCPGLRVMGSGMSVIAAGWGRALSVGGGRWLFVGRGAGSAGWDVRLRLRGESRRGRVGWSCRAARVCLFAGWRLSSLGASGIGFRFFCFRGGLEEGLVRRGGRWSTLGWGAGGDARSRLRESRSRCGGFWRRGAAVAPAFGGIGRGVWPSRPGLGRALGMSGGVTAFVFAGRGLGGPG